MPLNFHDVQAGLHSARSDFVQNQSQSPRETKSIPGGAAVLPILYMPESLP